MTVQKHKVAGKAGGKGAREIVLQPQNELQPDKSAPARERSNRMAEKTKNPASELLDEGVKNYEQALRAGLKLQEEAGKYWIKLANQAASPQDFQKQISSFNNEVIPATRKAMDDCIELIEQNSRTSVDLLKKGLDAARETSPADAQAKATEFCESTLKALKANAQAIVDINVKAMDSWFAFVKKAATAAAEAKA